MNIEFCNNYRMSIVAVWNYQSKTLKGNVAYPVERRHRLYTVKGWMKGSSSKLKLKLLDSPLVAGSSTGPKPLIISGGTRVRLKRVAVAVLSCWLLQYNIVFSPVPQWGMRRSQDTGQSNLLCERQLATFADWTQKKFNAVKYMKYRLGF